MGAPKAPEIVYRWRCPLQACNNEQSALYPDEEQCKTEFTKHVERHSSQDFVTHMLAGRWKGKFTLADAE